ncbi:hypothetical protein DFH28DRAFT_521369 [Melampsora americana]|nr:hypothetical protein DFH28DRAFT_521369 [Melampsora americana]
MSYKLAIITISDSTSKSFQNQSYQNQIIQSSFLSSKSNQIYSIHHQLLIPDDPIQIKHAILNLINLNQSDCIITTGGTGLHPTDQTYQTIEPLLDRQLPGLIHHLLSTSLTQTPFAALSNPIVGIRSSTLIISLPGSPIGAISNLNSLEPILPHALELIKGNKSKQAHQEIHKQQQQHSTDSHKQPQQSTDKQRQQQPTDLHDHQIIPLNSNSQPSKSQSQSQSQSQSESHLISQSQSISHSHSHSHPKHPRIRKSPWPIISFKDGLDRILNQTKALSTQTLHSLDPKLIGKVLVEDVIAQYDLPSSPTSNVDGYAIRSDTSIQEIYKVLSTEEYNKLGLIPNGSVYKINTGASLPIGTDSVIMIEDTEVVKHKDELEEESIKISLDLIHPAQHVRATGSDVRSGDLILKSGMMISENGGEIATLISNGIQEVRVTHQPTLAILSTGDELINLNQISSDSIQNGKVIDTNRPTLITSIKSQHHSNLIDLGIVPCDRFKLFQTFQTLLNSPTSNSLSMIICTGSTSMGDTDHLKEVLVEDLKAKIWFGRIGIKPGKPTIFATITMADQREVLVFGLPGNPASAFVTWNVLVRPCLRKMEGFPKEDWELPSVLVEVEDEFRLDEEREEFCRVQIEFDKTSKSLMAHSTGFQRSSCSVSLAGANGLLKLPMATQTKPMVMKGEVLEAILISSII